ncbi:hypothetical protein HOY34_20795 [Xinfangfangia sp. D13-10-4-6]|uniref:hypothetical protein n=1 Tax=Pseudogemmobacter hezensis TaxID=2737662 RepID=UPI0015528C84|nr:hypothetical protein [Pseudogemmobacter hezensis]NPD17627.1 hypothetical protein [Pseudogemmobacter hezensis]
MDPETSLWHTVARGPLSEGCDWGEVRDAEHQHNIAGALASMKLLDRAAQSCGSLDAADRLALTIARALATKPDMLPVASVHMDPVSAAALDRLAHVENVTIIVSRADTVSIPGWATGLIGLADGALCAT